MAEIIAVTAPIPFRRHTFGDYDIPALTLRPELAPGVVGCAAQRSAPGEAK